MNKVLLAVDMIPLINIKRGLELFEEKTCTKLYIDEQIETAKADAQKMVEALLNEQRKQISRKTSETIEMVIGTISLDQGWEESGDKYRKMYGLPTVYLKEINNELER
jgi:hypothetical protein